VTLQGADGLRARLAALPGVRLPIGRSWGTETVRQARQRIRVRTGKTRDTLRLASATEEGARIEGSRVAVILDRGAQAHDISAKPGGTLAFDLPGGLTVFAKKVHKPRQQGDGFLGQSAREGLRKTHMADELVRAWNGAS
jgi:hypothetical protein